VLREIVEAFFASLSSAGLGYPIAWPGTTFTPPASGIWLEPNVLPNTGIDNGLSNSDTVVPQGLLQVIAWARPGNGSLTITEAAETISAIFPKGTQIYGLVRVQRAPYFTELDVSGDKLGIMITIPYSQ
jgi:hypothetical protein